MAVVKNKFENCEKWQNLRDARTPQHKKSPLLPMTFGVVIMTVKNREIRLYLSLSGVCFFISGHITIYYNIYFYFFYDKKDKKRIVRIYRERYKKKGNCGYCQSFVSGSAHQDYARYKYRLFLLFTFQTRLWRLARWLT
jgi:hypothetical protein